MRDRPEFDNEAEAVASVAEPAAEAPVEAPVAPSEPPQADAAPPDPDMFPRDYVEELRRENAKWRTRTQQYEQAFDGYDDDTRQQLLTYFQLAKRAEAGDTAAQQELQAWLGDDDDDIGNDDDLPPMSRQEYEEFVREAARQEAERLLTEREAYQSQQAAVEGVRTVAEQMGYEHGSPDYILLLKFANELDPAEHPDLLAAAHQQVEAYHDSILERKNQAYLAQKEADTLAAPKVAAQGGNPDLSAGPPRTFAEARARMDERLANT